MTQELSKTDSREVLASEDQAVLDTLRQMNEPRRVIIKYDTIKFKDSEKKVEGLTRGNYFVESYDSGKPEGERKTYRDIGPNPEVVILHRAYTYSYYKENVGLVAFTTDIQGFSDDDYVQLFSRKNEGKMGIEFTGGYQQLKAYMEKNYVNDDGKLMTFQNVLYVLFEGKVYRMFVSNASAAGVADGEKSGDFKNPQPLSLLSFIETTKKEPGSAMCEYVCKLGSRFKDDVEQPYYIRTFTNVGRTKPDVLIAAVKEAKNILTDIMHQQKDIREKKGISELREEAVVDIPNVEYGRNIKVEDLPF